MPQSFREVFRPSELLKLSLVGVLSALVSAALVVTVYETGGAPTRSAIGKVRASPAAASSGSDNEFVALSAELQQRLQLSPDAGETLSTDTLPKLPLDGAGSGQTHPPVGDAALPSVEDMVGRLEARLTRAPDDFQGWMMLGWSRLRIGRAGEAVGAYRAALELEPESADALAGLGEALASANGGQVSEEAAQVMTQALAIDPSNASARFFLAQKKRQDGDPAGAVDDWIALLKSAPAGADWTSDVLARIREAADEAGVDLEGELPPQ